MKTILLSCFAISPYRGSEAICAWKTAYYLSKKYKVLVLTRENNKDEINNFFSFNSSINNLSFLYCESKFFYELYKLNGHFYFLYYKAWQKKAFKYLKNNNVLDSIDIIQHISLGDFREPGYLWKLKKKFIFGPVGGAQVTPKCFNNELKRHKLNEFLRKIINNFSIITIRYRKAMRNTQCIFTANYETEMFLKKKYNNKIITITENGVDIIKENKLKSFNKQLKFLWCGRLIYRKGLIYILKVIYSVDKSIIFNIYGEGPEKTKLLNFIKNNNLYNVKIKDPLPYAELQKIYNDYDVFLFPSLRETTGTVLLEAMAHKLPILTCDAFGAKVVIKNKELLVNVNQDSTTVFDDFCNYIKGLIENKYNLNKISEENFDFCMTQLSWVSKIENFEKVYEEK